MLSFLGLLTSPSLLENVPRYDQIQIIKESTLWIDTELTSSHENSLNIDAQESVTSGAGYSAELIACCELFPILVSRVLPWEPSGTPQGVLSVTCYDTSPKSSLFEKVGVTKSGDQFVSPSTTSLNHEPSVWNHAPSSSMQVSPFSPTHSSKGVLESRGSGTSSTLSSPPLSAVCSGIIISISLWGASMTMLHGQASCGIVWQSGWSMALPLRTRHPPLVYI
jgi:hypothetical protein